MIDSSYKDDNPLAVGSCPMGTAYEKYQHQDVDSPQICKNNPLKINPSTQLEAQITSAGSSIFGCHNDDKSRGYDQQ